MTSVVVIDDDQEAVENLSSYLGIHNIETLGTANDSSSALELYETYAPITSQNLNW